MQLTLGQAGSDSWWWPSVFSTLFHDLTCVIPPLSLSLSLLGSFVPHYLYTFTLSVPVSLPPYTPLSHELSFFNVLSINLVLFSFVMSHSASPPALARLFHKINIIVWLTPVCGLMVKYGIPLVLFNIMWIERLLNYHGMQKTIW